MRSRVLAAAMVGVCLAAGPVLAAPLTAKFVDTVTPYAELTAFLQSLVQTAQEGIGTQSRAYAVLDTMIADTVVGFGRGLDPLEPWRRIDVSGEDLTGVDLLTAHLVERGDLPGDGTPLPDYRQNLLELLVALVGNPTEPLGTMPELEGAVCSPARYGFNAKATLKFAQAHETDAYGIYLFPRSVELRDNPDVTAPVMAKLAPYTLFVTDYQADQPDGWTKLVASDGVSGWSQDQGDYEGLSQQHLCFGKVDGAYKITGFFTYGL